jgi:hypothetical protein
MNKYIIIFFIIICILLVIYIIYKIYKKNKINNTSSNASNNSSTDIIPLTINQDSIVDYTLTLYTSLIEQKVDSYRITKYKMFENGPWNPLNLATLITTDKNNLWNNCWTETNIQTVNNRAIDTNIKDGGLRASDFIYIELVGQLKCGFNPPVDRKFIPNIKTDPRAITITQNKIFYMFSEEVFNNKNTITNIPLYVLDEFSGELQRFLITLTSDDLIVVPDDPIRANFAYTKPKYIDNTNSKTLKNILNNQASLIISHKLKDIYTIDTFANDIILYNKNDNSIVYSGNSYNNTGQVCRSPIKLSDIIKSDYIPVKNTNNIYTETNNYLNIFIYLTGGLRWGFKPRDKNGLFPLDNYSFPNFTVRIINDKIFVCRVIENINPEPIVSTQTIEFDLYLYNPIWDDDFSIHVKVEISYSTFLPIYYNITVSTVNNITDSELNIFPNTIKPINIDVFKSEPMFLYIGPKLYIPFNIRNRDNMMELYKPKPDSTSNEVILKCSVYEGDEEDKCKIQSKYTDNEAKAIKLCPPKPKEIDKVFSINKIPISPYISTPITFNFNKYIYDYTCIIICLLGPLSIGLSIPTIDGEFDANRYKLSIPDLEAIPISEKVLIIKSNSKTDLTIPPIDLYVYDKIYGILQIFSISRKSYYTTINGAQILNIYPADIKLIYPINFIANIHKNDIPIAEIPGVNIQKLSYVYLGPLIFENIIKNQDITPNPGCIPNCTLDTFGKDDGCGSKCENITLFNSPDMFNWFLKISDPLISSNILISKVYRINKDDNSYPLNVKLLDSQHNIIFNVSPSILDYNNKNIYANITLVFDTETSDSNRIKYNKLINNYYEFDREKNKYIGLGIELYPNFFQEQNQCLSDFEINIEKEKQEVSINIANSDLDICNANDKFKKNSDIYTSNINFVDPKTFIRNSELTSDYINSTSIIYTIENAANIYKVENYYLYKKDKNKKNYKNKKFKQTSLNDELIVFSKNFSLKREYPDQIEIPRDQKNCKSCYIMAVISCLGDRFALKYNIKSPYPSIMWVWSACDTFEIVNDLTYYLCDFCDGGTSDRISRWLYKNYTKLESCFPYSMLEKYKNLDVYNTEDLYYGADSSDYKDKCYECLNIENSIGIDKYEKLKDVKFSITELSRETILPHYPSNGDYTPFDIELLVKIMKYKLCRGSLVAAIEINDSLRNFLSNEWLLDPTIVFTNTQGVTHLDCFRGHSVTITGWGKGIDQFNNEVEYWEVRNSWGLNNTGYFRVAITTFSNQINTIGLDIPSIYFKISLGYDDIKKFASFYFDPAPIENLDELIELGIFEKSNNTVFD